MHRISKEANIIKSFTIPVRYQKGSLLVLTLLGLAILGIYLKLLNPQNVIGLLKSANLNLVLISCLINIIYLTLYGFIWWYVLRSMKIKTRLPDCIVGGYISLLGDIIIPSASVSGEFLRMTYGMYRLSIDGSIVLTSIAIHRLLNSLSFGLVVILGFIGIILTSPITGYGQLLKYISLAIIAVFLTLCGLYFVFHSDRVADYLYKRGWAKNLAEFLKKMSQYSTTFKRNLLDSIMIFVIITLRWILGTFIVFFLFLSVGYHVNYWYVLFAYPLYGISMLIPIGIPAMIGIMDTAMITIFVVLGIEKSIVVTVAILNRLVTTGLTILYISLISSFLGLSDMLSKLTKSNKH